MKKTVFCFLFIWIGFLGFSGDLEISDLTNYFDGNWIVAGLIKNNGETAYSFVSLSLACRSADDQLVHTDTTYAFSPIPPHSEIPFSFLASSDDAKGISTFGVSIDNAYRGGSGTFNFTFSQLSITERNSTYIKYSGEITNNSGSMKQFPHIAFIGFNSNGDLVYFDTTYPNKSNLPPEESSLFDFLVPPHMSAEIEQYICIAYAD